MTKKEYLEKLPSMEVDAAKVKKVQDVYVATLSDEVKRIVSNCNESIFFDDDCRILSFAEILDAEKDLHVDFKAKGLLPVADCGDNDFIVWHFKDGSWSKFNIVDDTSFKFMVSFMI